MQRLFLLLTVIISRAVASPIAQVNPDGSFDIALSGFDDSGALAAEPFQISETDSPSQAPPQAPPSVPQPGDPVFNQQAQPKPNTPNPAPTPEENNPVEEPKNKNQPFECGAGKSGACCVGGTRDGQTSGCIRFKVFDDWCQKPEWFKCCKSQAQKDQDIEAGTVLDDHVREDCEDPKEVSYQPKQNWGSNLLHMIIPQGGGVEPGLPFPKGVWMPDQ